MQTPEVTDLQTQLATLLGYTPWTKWQLEGSVNTKLPSLPELVATALVRLTKEQQDRYVTIMVKNTAIHAYSLWTFDVTLSKVDLFRLMHTSKDTFDIRARALIQTLSK